MFTSPCVAQQPYSAPRASDGHADIGGVWSNGGEDVRLEQTVDGVLQTVPFENPVDANLPLRDRTSALAWREKYGI